MSDWDVGDVSSPRWLQDLETVVAAARPREPFALFGISQGAATAVSYAARHPERVSHLILYGGYSAGWRHRDAAEELRAYESIVELTRHGWGKDNPVFRQLFTSRFVPGGTAEQLQWFNELCRRTTSASIAAALLEARSDVDVRDQLESIRTPTLVFCRALLEFTGRDDRLVGDREAAEFRTLTPREREILSGICKGANNASIGKSLFIAEKTVRNHVTSLFEKLGVVSRAEAIVRARDGGFRG